MIFTLKFKSMIYFVIFCFEYYVEDMMKYATLRGWKILKG